MLGIRSSNTQREKQLIYWLSCNHTHIVSEILSAAPSLFVTRAVRSIFLQAAASMLPPPHLPRSRRLRRNAGISMPLVSLPGSGAGAACAPPAAGCGLAARAGCAAPPSVVEPKPVAMSVTSTCAGRNDRQSAFTVGLLDSLFGRLHGTNRFGCAGCRYAIVLHAAEGTARLCPAWGLRSVRELSIQPAASISMHTSPLGMLGSTTAPKMRFAVASTRS